MTTLLFTRANTASWNIAEHLIEEYGFEKKEEHIWEREEITLIDTRAPGILEVPTDFDTDLLLVLSSHKSKTGKPALTAHIPGNWNNADFGGESRTLNIAYASMLRRILLEMEKAGEKYGMGWQVSLETDHHGPTCKVPIIFVEIGSTEKEWRNKAAGRVVAEAVSEAIGNAKPGAGNQGMEVVAGFGGGHYAREFTELVINNNIAVGHICPKYALDGIGEDTFRQAIERNVEKTTKVLVVKEGTNVMQKEQIRKLAATFDVEYSEF
jgi:D-aminoacyl-tRNA deacylase